MNKHDFTKIELRILKESLVNSLLHLNKDLKKSILDFDYDEIKNDIEILDDYSRVLFKVSRLIQYYDEEV